MDATTTTQLRRVAALFAVIPLVAACGGGHGHDGASPTGGTSPALNRGASLVITTDNGVRLRPADGDTVGVDRRVDGHWSHRDDTWVLDLSCPAEGERHEDCPRMPEIDVPADTAVSVSARNAGIDVAGISAGLDLTTVNGDVSVARSGGRGAAVRLTTRNGSIHAQTLRAERLHADTVNGDVVLDCGSSPDGATAATTNGSVRVTVPHDAPAYRVSATTHNGRPSVTVPTSGATEDRTMTLTTVNGDVTAART
ncbi:DUF4097 family beta strand repeat-containing protein [Streptomyces sp. NPDC004082]|uniref:DUF4097 family beta strand repeat-containing protein n=1 Tax=unclassified Streptomyces TaxID=2593676 RepID=UPI0033AACA81